MDGPSAKPGQVGCREREASREALPRDRRVVVSAVAGQLTDVRPRDRDPPRRPARRRWVLRDAREAHRAELDAGNRGDAHLERHRRHLRHRRAPAPAPAAVPPRAADDAFRISSPPWWLLYERLN